MAKTRYGSTEVGDRGGRSGLESRPDAFADESTLGLATSHGAPSGPSLRIVQDSIVTTLPLPQQGELVIGRSPSADIRIEHPSISRRHAVLRMGSSVSIADLGSANGTRVGQRQIHEGESVVVQANEVMEVGSVMLVLQGNAGPKVALPQLPDSDRGTTGAGPMQLVHGLIERVAAGTISVLISGETGVGKEVAAELVHGLSPRAQKPLVKLNCAAFSENLLTTELFGHERGAFSGADREKQGLLEVAHGGSVFLDELGELPLSLQAKLLRVLEDRAVLRVGAVKPRPIDVRFIAATNRDLKAEVARGAFRQDLYFRLNGVSVFIPPLRERRDEIPLLAQSFVRELAGKLEGRRAPALSAEFLRALMDHDWPGNVRELRNLIERSILMCTGDTLTVDLIPVDDMRAPAAVTSPPPTSSRSPFLEESPRSEDPGVLREKLLVAERERILAALQECAGNQTKAAKLLGISRGTLVTRLETFGVPRPRKKT